jgi:hypothetical protein
LHHPDVRAPDERANASEPRHAATSEQLPGNSSVNPGIGSPYRSGAVIAWRLAVSGGTERSTTSRVVLIARVESGRSAAATPTSTP